MKSAESNLAPVNYAFINLNSDMNTHLFITSDNGKELVYETWNVTEADDGLITWQFRDSHFLKRDGYIGISTFVDIGECLPVNICKSTKACAQWDEKNPHVR